MSRKAPTPPPKTVPSGTSPATAGRSVNPPPTNTSKPKPPPAPPAKK